MLDFTQNLMHSQIYLLPASQNKKKKLKIKKKKKKKKKQTVAEKRISTLSVV